MRMKRLWLGILLIAMAAGILLISDWNQRVAPVTASTAAPPIGKTWKVRVIQLNNSAEVEETEHGLRQGLLEAKLVEGRDYEMKIGNAQADMATLSTLMDSALSERADLIVAFSTPTLQVALRKVERTPVVYTYVGLGVTAGVGPSREDHRVNVTGVDVISAYQEMVDLIGTHFPHWRRVGTLYSPAEINMVVQKELIEESFRKAGIELISVPVNTSTEVADAALALTAKGLDAIVQIPGNLTAISFGAILKAAVKAKLAAFAFTGPQAMAGAPVSLARDYEESGRLAAQMVARIMRGADPKNIPIEQVMGATLYVNRTGARAANLQIPPALLKRADRVIGD